MTDTPAAAIAELQSYEGDARAIESDFGERLRALGAREVLVHLFRSYSDSTLRFWLKSLAFLWKDVPYGTWLEVLGEIAEDRRFVYQFLWFASESLALDIHRLPIFDPNIEIELSGETFRDGGPLPISARLRERLGDDFDYEAVWGRLADEGAPMRDVPPDEPDRHVLEV